MTNQQAYKVNLQREQCKATHAKCNINNSFRPQHEALPSPDPCKGRLHLSRRIPEVGKPYHAGASRLDEVSRQAVSGIQRPGEEPYRLRIANAGRSTGKLYGAAFPPAPSYGSTPVSRTSASVAILSFSQVGGRPSRCHCGIRIYPMLKNPGDRPTDLRPPTSHGRLCSNLWRHGRRCPGTSEVRTFPRRSLPQGRVCNT